MYSIKSLFRVNSPEATQKLNQLKPSDVDIEVIPVGEPINVLPITMQIFNNNIFRRLSIAIQLLETNGIMPISPVIILTMDRSTLHKLFFVTQIPSSYAENGVLLTLRPFDVHDKETREFMEYLSTFSGTRQVAIAPLGEFNAQLFGWELRYHRIAVDACNKAIQLCNIYHDTSMIVEAIKAVQSIPDEIDEPGKCKWIELFFKREIENEFENIPSNYVEVVPRTDEKARVFNDDITAMLETIFEVHPIGTNMKYRPINNLGHLAYMYVEEAINAFREGIIYDTNKENDIVKGIDELEKFLKKYKKYTRKPIRLGLIISNTGKVETDKEDSSILHFEESNQILEFKDLKDLMNNFIPYIDDGHVHLRFKSVDGIEWDALRTVTYKTVNPMKSIKKFRAQLFQLDSSSS